MRIFVAFIIILACVIGMFSYISPHAFAYMAPETAAKTLIAFHNFFDITLPILAFGALIKYLCSSHHHI